MLSWYRPLRSILTRTPLASRAVVNRLSVNCAPWSVLNICGLPSCLATDPKFGVHISF